VSISAALVTGAAGGIGYERAGQLAARGTVIIAARESVSRKRKGPAA
jgi:short-subunit dehydrogenase